MRTGIIRTYDDTEGTGTLLDLEEEGVLSFMNFPGLNFVPGSRVKFTQISPPSSDWTAQGVITELEAE